MKKADWHLVEEWVAQYPIGSKVEVHYGRHGWIKATVASHSHHYTCSIKVNTAQGPLYYAYGTRREIRLTKEE